MPKIRYEFVDGTSCVYHADRVWYEVCEGLTQQEKCNHWRETRRHVFFGAMPDNVLKFGSEKDNPLINLLASENNEKLFGCLSADQRELLETVYIDGKTMTEIARHEGVDSSSVRHRMMRIMKKLKKIFADRHV